MTATRNLLKIALQERLNQKFILLSEAGIPLYPPTTLYHQLMTEEKSRINACTLPGVRLFLSGFCKPDDIFSTCKATLAF